MTERITKVQMHLLAHIEKEPYQDIETIADDMGMKKNVVSRMIHDLETKGIITYTFDPKGGYGNYNSNGGAGYTDYGWVIVKQREQENTPITSGESSK